MTNLRVRGDDIEKFLTLCLVELRMAGALRNYECRLKGLGDVTKEVLISAETFQLGTERVALIAGDPNQAVFGFRGGGPVALLADDSLSVTLTSSRF